MGACFKWVFQVFLGMAGLVSPEEFYGFKPGEDRRLVRWDQVVEYFWMLDRASPRVRVEEVGKSTMGRPMIVAYVSSEGNLARLDELRRISWSLGHPGGLGVEELEELVGDGRVVVAMTMSIHASEVGGTQGASGLVYDLVTREDELFRRIRENVVLVLFPCANPDGQVMTVDWYNETLGTEYEGGPLPWLYHKYVGHDNNRDALTLTQVETRLMNRVILGEWFPQVYLDHHQMGFYGARFFVPPNANPVNEVVDPLVWTEQKLFGSHMAFRMESSGLPGVEQAAVFPADFMPGFSLVFPWFGICGMFTESASVRVATPVYVHYHQLQPHPRGRPEYRANINFPNPWKGGWWHLRDILKGQYEASIAALEVAANHRETLLRNMYRKALRSIERGRQEPPYAYVFPPGQWDPNTAARLLQTLMDLSVEVHVAEEPFKVGEVVYPAGSYVVFTSQPARAFLVCLLSRSLYRDSVWVRNREGVPLMNYDFATQTLAEFKGVEVVEAVKPVEGRFRRVDSVRVEGCLEGEGRFGFLVDCRVNDSFKAVNRVKAAGGRVFRASKPLSVGGVEYPPGCWVVEADRGLLEEVAGELGLRLVGLDEPPGELVEVEPLKVAVYQRYWGGNMDEGWTRWLLEQFGFDYQTVRDEEVKQGLSGYHVLVLPSDPVALITGEKVEEYYEKRFKGAFAPPHLPPEYRSGLGEEGVAKVKEFVEGGGTVLALNESCDFASEKLGVPVFNPLKDVPPEKFHCPGSTLWAEFDSSHPLAYGMPRRGLLLLRGSRALAVKGGHFNENYRVVASYPEEGLLQSGWLIGEELLARKAAVVEAKLGKGRVVLYGFSPQARALTDATFKLFFNALVGPNPLQGS